MEKYKNWAPIVLRLGLAFVFIWFGTSQLLDQNMWTGIVPAWATALSGLSPLTIVLVNGMAEIILGAMLALDLFTSVVAILLSIHILIIIFDLGLNAIGIRDIGLLFALISIALNSRGNPSVYPMEKVL